MSFYDTQKLAQKMTGKREKSSVVPRAETECHSTFARACFASPAQSSQLPGKGCKRSGALSLFLSFTWHEKFNHAP